jgi:DNA-binding LacI/PurR family transcriptional regulator
VGVSSATVSIYLNDPDTTRVGEETKRRIDVAIEELDYRPNMIAKALSTQRTGVVGVMIPYDGPLFGSSFLDSMLSGIQSELFARGYSMLFLPTKGENSPAVVRNQLKVAHGYDGVIISGTRYCDLDDLNHNVEQLLESGLPFSTVNMPVLDYEINQAILRVPLEESPTKYLYESGHREVLLLSGREKDADSVTSVQQYRHHTLNYLGAVDDSRILYGDFEDTVARSAVQSAISAGVTFSAIHAISDTMALGAYEALAEAGLRVPEDVSVVGMNDSYFSRRMSPPLTTYRRPIFRAGQEAARGLLRTLETGRTGRKVQFDGELVFRSSTRTVPVSA